MMLIRHVIKDREPYSMNASATVGRGRLYGLAQHRRRVCTDDAGKLLACFLNETCYAAWW